MNSYFLYKFYLTVFVILSFGRCVKFQDADTINKLGINQITKNEEFIQDKNTHKQFGHILKFYLEKGENLNEYGSLQEDRQKKESRLDIYQQTAAISGGIVQKVNKSDIYGAVGVITEATLTNPVLLQKWQLSTKDSTKEFYVDHTMATLLVEIYSTTAPQCKITNACGKLLSADSKNTTFPVNSATTRFVRVDYPVPGKWKISCGDHHRYNITVRGSSLVEFNHKFINDFGFDVPGRPIAGTNMTLAIEVFGMKYLANVSHLLLTSLSSGDVLSKYQAGKPIGRQHNLFRSQLTIPTQDFMVGIVGYDKSGGIIERMSENHIIPEGIKLVLKELSEDFPPPGGKYKIQYEIANDGAENGTYHVDVTVNDKIFSYMIQPRTVHLDDGGHVSGNITFSASGKAGDSSLAVVSVTGPSGTSQYSNIQLVIEGSFTTKNTSPKSVTVPSGSTTIMSSSFRLVTNRKTPTTYLNNTAKMFSRTSNPSKSSVVTNMNSSHIDKTKPMPNTTVLVLTSSTSKTSNIKSMSRATTVLYSSSNVGSVNSFPNTTMAAYASSTAHMSSDIKPPAFTKVDYIDNCRSDEACDKYRWIVLFQVQDDESGVHRVDVEDKTISSISIESFDDGLSKTPIHGNVSINCCNKQVTIIVEDMEGNRGRIPVHYPYNSSTITHTGSGSLSSLQIAAIVVGSFASCLVAVIVSTVIVQFKSYLDKRMQKRPVKKLASVV